MNIFIDFDRTLFNTDLFLDDLNSILKKYQVPSNLYEKYNRQREEEGFNPLEVINIINSEIKIDERIYEEYDNLIKNGAKYTYPDAEPFLKDMQKKKYNIILFTKGNNEFQLSKIKSTNLLKYFSSVLTTLKDKGELDLDYKNSIFIDDNKEELESILKRKPKRIIRIRRKDTKYYDDIVKKNIEEVSSLEEIKL